MDSKLTEADDEEEKGNKSIEKQEEDDALFLWDCVSLFDTKVDGFTETGINIRNKCDNKKSRFVK